MSLKKDAIYRDSYRMLDPDDRKLSSPVLRRKEEQSTLLIRRNYMDKWIEITSFKYSEYLR
ncbi:MAG: hypothetical protein EHM20_05515 [Alphaproteobacteria bacterium]|nr:MAG: hypothetical protein EHM20_05515 [Alphaproteobacteria bacterium]